MTREELSKILETFAVLVIKTTISGVDPDTQYALISGGIDTITETVMFVTDKNRAVRPSIN